MIKTSFSLDLDPKGEVVRCPEPAQVVVPLAGHSTKTVKKKAEVAPGSLVADHPGKNTGDAHASIFGVVAEVGAKGVVINAQEVEAACEPISTQGLSGDALKNALKKLGIDTLPFTKAKTIIVNGLNPEPGMAIASYLLAQQSPLLSKGLDALKRLTGATTCKLVSASGKSASLEGCSAVQVSGVYPGSVHPLLVKAATGRESARETLCVDVHSLYLIGQAVETGLPVTTVLLSVGDKIVQAKVGQAIGEILQAAGVSIADNDSVILGGPLRGVAVPDLQTGLPKDAYALTVVRAGLFPEYTDTPCINCGNCVAHCPARIRPNMIGRYAEFKKYSDTRNYGIDSCFECGLCAYWCTARRPLLQYIRLAKQVLAAQDAQQASCALNE